MSLFSNAWNVRQTCRPGIWNRLGCSELPGGRLGVGLSSYSRLDAKPSYLLPRDLDHNEISGTIEDTSGAFTGLDSLSKL